MTEPHLKPSWYVAGLNFAQDIQAAEDAFEAKSGRGFTPEEETAAFLEAAKNTPAMIENLEETIKAGEPDSQLKKVFNGTVAALFFHTGNKQLIDAIMGDPRYVLHELTEEKQKELETAWKAGDPKPADEYIIWMG